MNSRPTASTAASMRGVLVVRSAEKSVSKATLAVLPVGEQPAGLAGHRRPEGGAQLPIKAHSTRGCPDKPYARPLPPRSACPYGCLPTVTTYDTLA
jgi:hypothetical protein